uniref:Uncharacterized protein n=1 Tax=Gloeochaete wittrockiana TaxID=38269 RepID=A0A3G1IW00_9EUKA|nr:hypothetical protein [Gloeochaete wittrockiana]ASQ40212.1 hypothetical protein [Gloeochaete wittrockiana]
MKTLNDVRQKINIYGGANYVHGLTRINFCSSSPPRWRTNLFCNEVNEDNNLLNFLFYFSDLTLDFTNLSFTSGRQRQIGGRRRRSLEGVHPNPVSILKIFPVELCLVKIFVPGLEKLIPVWQKLT